MNSDIKYTLTNECITVVLPGGKTHTVQRGAPNFASLRGAIVNEKWDEVPLHLNVAKSVASWARGFFSVDGDRVLHRGEPIPASLNRRIHEMARDGLDPSLLFRFWERLEKNPSHRSVTQLWDFLQHQHIPLTPEGTFLAYKSVRSDFMDHHTGTVANTPGSVHEMPRNKISDDPNEACHYGFHVGSIDYARTFRSMDSSRIMICEVDPEHVVCVPYDASSQKMRVCRYKVTGHYAGNLSSTVCEEEDYDHDLDDMDDEFEGDDMDDVHTPFDNPEEEDTSPGPKVEVPKTLKTEKPQLKVPRKYQKYQNMDMRELLDVSIEKLREYAGKGLKIVGASKIPGGKLALVDKIIEIRGS